MKRKLKQMTALNAYGTNEVIISIEEVIEVAKLVAIKCKKLMKEEINIANC